MTDERIDALLAAKAVIAASEGEGEMPHGVKVAIARFAVECHDKLLEQARLNIMGAEREGEQAAEMTDQRLEAAKRISAYEKMERTGALDWGRDGFPAASLAIELAAEIERLKTEFKRWGAFWEMETKEAQREAAEAETHSESLAKALREISALKNAAEVKGDEVELALTPAEFIKDGGWIPLHPRTVQGLRIAAMKADAALTAHEKADKPEAKP